MAKGLYTTETKPKMFRLPTDPNQRKEIIKRFYEVLKQYQIKK